MPIYPLGSTGGGGGAVTSVNGSTGAVIVDLSSVLNEGNDADALQIKNAANATDPQDLVTLAQLSAIVTSTPVAIDWADIPTETAAGNLVNGQVYNIQNAPALTSGLTPIDLFSYAYTNTLNSRVEMSPECVGQLSGLGTSDRVLMVVDWATLSIVKVFSVDTRNLVCGVTNIDNFPFGNTKIYNNRVGEDFSIDFTGLNTLGNDFKNNTCYGNYTFVTGIAVSYIGIDFSKGYLSYMGLVTQSGTSDPVLTTQKNEYGFTVTPSYNGPGDYRCDITSGFGATVDKCWLHIGNPAPTLTADTYIFWVSDSRFDINTQVFGAGQDDILNNTPIEIRTFF